MIGLATAFVLGATVFVPQEIPGLRVGEVQLLTGSPTLDFRQADFDGDGRIDILLSDRLYFQRQGLYPAEESVALPGSSDHPLCDVDANSVYLRYPGRLVVHSWESGQWRTLLDQALAWPEEGVPEQSPADGFYPSPGYRFGRFLHDLDSTGYPEIIVPHRDGVHVYRADTGEYAIKSVLNVYPAPRLLPAERMALWPADERRLELPPSRMACTVAIEKTKLLVITRHELRDMRVRFRVESHALQIAEDKTVAIESAGVVESAPVPDYLEPCRLNADELLDFAGGRWELSEASPMPSPIYELAASLDGGKTVQTIRSHSYKPQCVFIDFDGDGNLDLVAESTGMLRGGIRETLGRFLTRRTIEHEISVRFQTNGAFATTAAVRHQFDIRLTKAPYQNGSLFQRYQTGELVNVTGDFDGDGKRDIAIQDREDRVAVYQNRNHAFAATPAFVIEFQSGARFAVADIDGDGRSDIVVYTTETDGVESIEKTLVHLSREDVR